MTDDILAVDISDTPILVRLAEEVQRTRTPRLLQRDGEDIALLLPMPVKTHQNQQAKTPADYEAFRQAAGSWQDVDTERLLAEIRESRQMSVSPLVDL